MFQGYRPFPNSQPNSSSKVPDKPQDNVDYYLTLTLLAMLFIGTLVILIAVVLELIDQEQKEVRLRLKQQLSSRKRYAKRKRRSYSTKKG